MNKKQKLIELWRLCFEDTEDFIQLFFDRIYKGENALIIEVDGEIVSALHMIPYTMGFCNSELTVSYIAGACTHPDYRGKGYMGELLEETFDVMRKRDFDLTALIPASPSLFEYYRRHGYTEIFDYTLAEAEFPKILVLNEDIELHVVNEDSIETAYSYFDHKLRERTCCILHTKEDFITSIIEFRQDEGEVVLAINKKGIPVGIAFLYPSIDHVYIKEFMSDNEQIEEIILQEVMLRHRMKRVQYLTPPQLPDSHRLGMGMILNREKSTGLWLAANSKFPITQEGLDKMDIQTLTRHLLNYTEKYPYMSLMHD